MMAANLATGRLRVPAIAEGSIIAAGCCPVPAAAAATQILMFVDGVTDVEVDEATGDVTVTYDPALTALKDLAEELTFIGLPVAAPESVRA
jgi:copper chaperone CopZ